ncbi:MAG TPA: TraB/GumN family protein, partial [Octadecabacter sp.]|nr:TraB/GumN family protein [Octadecabacter sp.]
PRHDALLARVAPDLERSDILLVEATLEDQAALQTQIANNPDMMMITNGPSL